MEAGKRLHRVEGLEGQAQLAVVDGIVLGRVIDVRHLADVKLLLLVTVECLEQLAPAHAQQQRQDTKLHSVGNFSTRRSPMQSVQVAMTAAIELTPKLKP